jgi:hypothetical protein
VNPFQRFIVDALLTQSRHIRHIEHKLDLLLEHLGVTLPPELVSAGEDLAKKTEALRVALDAQAQTPTQKEPS